MANNIGALEKCLCKRWAFSVQKNMEDENFERHFRTAIQAISAEEYLKVAAYRHKQDSLSNLAGRLFLRQAVRSITGAQWADIEFGRTERGKPYVSRPEGISFGLNVSHQGDLTVLATSCASRVGVDVMKLDMCRGNKTADEYINSMAKSASQDELRNMRAPPTEQMKMTVFYRYWCLKEAVLKATGEGIVDDLSRYDFRIDPGERYKKGCFLTSTILNVDGKLQPQWVFEESFVDDNHAIAVCREKSLPKCCAFSANPDAKLFFSKVDFDFLLEGATIVNPMVNGGAEEYNNFMQKPRKTF